MNVDVVRAVRTRPVPLQTRTRNLWPGEAGVLAWRLKPTGASGRRPSTSLQVSEVYSQHCAPPATFALIFQRAGFSGAGRRTP